MIFQLNGSEMADWRDQAACKGGDLSAFFEDDEYKVQRYSRAMPVCQRCPVSSECLAEALSYEGRGTRFGLWGGLTPAQRDRYRRRLRVMS